MGSPARVGGPSATSGYPDATVRRVWVWHVLFAVSLLVPTVVTAVDTSTQPGSRSATIAIAAAWAALYLAFVQRVDDWDGLRSRDALGYFGLAIGFLTVLIVRNDVYFLVVYALYPQAFLFLGRGRWVGVVAVTGVLASAPSREWPTTTSAPSSASSRPPASLLRSATRTHLGEDGDSVSIGPLPPVDVGLVVRLNTTRDEALIITTERRSPDGRGR